MGSRLGFSDFWCCRKSFYVKMLRKQNFQMGFSHGRGHRFESRAAH